MSKNIRQNKILEIISNSEVDTQEELANLLVNYGFNVTQATVSRDIKELGLIKVGGREKKYRYAAETDATGVNNEKMLNLFKNCVIAIERANNLVIVKTLGGNGNSAGVIVDKLKLREIVGSVAGDDTLLIVARSDEDAETVVNTLTDLL